MTYEDSVAQHLHLRGSRRDRALADLGELVTELRASGSDPEDVLGEAARYAAALDAEFGATARPRTPGELAAAVGSRIGRRMAGTFDPADQRLLVPRALGFGWDLNMGAVATVLGLLRPDDVDEEILASATEQHGGRARGIAAGVTALAATTAVVTRLGGGRRPARESGPGQDRLAGVMELVAPVLSAALIAGSTDERVPSGQRLTMTAFAGSLSAFALGSGLNGTVACGRNAVSAASVLAGTALHLLLSYLPVRAALESAWRTTATETL
nr:hypothetical protein [Actinomycetales bacterium]